MREGKIQWHSAFYATLQIELEEDRDRLEFEEEHLLGKKPMQIDVVVIKKIKNTRIKKNIGHIFRQYNIVEYKSPDDYLNINDFYKVYGYACFYQSDTEHVGEVDPTEITITFVCNHYPKKMLKHLKKVRGMKVVPYITNIGGKNTIHEGVFYLEGDSIPIQLLITSKLSKEENYWLQNLRKDLKAGGEISNLIERYEEKKHSNLYKAAVDVILRANWKEVEVEKSMCEALRELFADELRESREEGISQGIKIGSGQTEESDIRKVMKNLKMTAKQAMEVLEIPLEEQQMYMERLQ